LTVKLTSSKSRTACLSVYFRLFTMMEITIAAGMDGRHIIHAAIAMYIAQEVLIPFFVLESDLIKSDLTFLRHVKRMHPFISNIHRHVEHLEHTFKAYE